MSALPGQRPSAFDHPAVGGNREFNFDTILACPCCVETNLRAMRIPRSGRELTSEVARVSQHALCRGTDGSTACSLLGAKSQARARTLISSPLRHCHLPV